MILLKCCTQYARKSGKLNSGRSMGKCQFHSNLKERAMPKNVRTTGQLHSFLMRVDYAQNPLSYTSAVCELRNSRVQAGFRKGRGTRDQIVNICWIIEKAREFHKNIYFCYIDTAKLLCGHNKLWKILKEIGIPGHLTYLLRNLYVGQKQQLEKLEAAVRTLYGTNDWLKIGKVV